MASDGRAAGLALLVAGLGRGQGGHAAMIGTAVPITQRAGGMQINKRPNDSQNVITIERGDGQAGRAIFRAPADNQAARALWVFHG